MDIKSTFAKKLKLELAKSGITQKELAARLDTPPTTINSWATARTFPHGETLQAIAEILNTTPSKLVADDNDDDDYQLSDSNKYLLLAVNSSESRRRLIDICLKIPEERIESAISILNTISNL